MAWTWRARSCVTVSVRPNTPFSPAVVFFFEDSFLNDSVKLVQIDNKPGIRMRLTSHGHLEHIVVPVPIGAEALPKRLYIPCLTLGGIMETMRGVKEHAARDVDSAHDLCVEGGSRMPP